MKKIKITKSKKTFIVSLFLIAAIAGTATTIAFAVAQSGSVINNFFAADHNTGIDENVSGNLNKDVRVKNDAKNSPAFIRVRLTVSPDTASNDIALIYQQDLSNWVEADDGFWYYLKAVPAGGYTDYLLDAVSVSDDFSEPFDVTVYEESCVAIIEPGDKTDLATIQATFQTATN